MKKMLRSVALPPGMDSKVFAVISALRAEAYDEIHAIEPYTVEAAITALQNSVAVIEDDIDNLQTDMTTAQGNISSLDGRVTVVEEDLATLDVTFILSFIDYFISYCVDAAGNYLTDEAGNLCIVQRL
jgi:peptidoglycan hydrolase CwlO-like protein